MIEGFDTAPARVSPNSSVMSECAAPPDDKFVDVRYNSNAVKV